MSIVRAARKNQFYVLPTSTIEDNRLSWEARGMLVYLLSKPDHWEVNIKDLLARTRNCLGRRSGRDKVYLILKELQMAGYIVRQYDRQGGVFQGITYEVSETPDFEAGEAFIASQQKGKPEPFTDLPETGTPPAETPHTAQPDTVKPDALVNNKQAVSIEEAVKNLTPEPEQAGEQPDDLALTEEERKTLSLAPANYPQSPKSKTFATWLAYAIAFHSQYREWPVYNAVIGTQLSKLIARIGGDVAPITARYYIEAVTTTAIKANCHPISSLLLHCESYVVMAKSHEKQRARRAVNAQAVEAAIQPGPAQAAASAAPAADSKPEITETAKQARALLGQLMGGKLKQQLTA